MKQICGLLGEITTFQFNQIPDGFLKRNIFLIYSLDEMLVNLSWGYEHRLRLIQAQEHIKRFLLLTLLYLYIRNKYHRV